MTITNLSLVHDVDVMSTNQRCILLHSSVAFLRTFSTSTWLPGNEDLRSDALFLVNYSTACPSACQSLSCLSTVLSRSQPQQSEAKILHQADGSHRRREADEANSEKVVTGWSLHILLTLAGSLVSPGSSGLPYGLHKSYSLRLPIRRSTRQHCSGIRVLLCVSFCRLKWPTV